MSVYVEPLVYRPGRWSLAVTDGPDTEPVYLTDLKLHLRETGTDQDTLITDMGIAARQVVENITRRALITQTRVLMLDDFPSARHQVIELPGGVIQSVTSIAYTDADDASAVWGSANYVLDNGTTGGTARIGLAPGAEWPETGDAGLAVTITYVAGWEAAGDVPPALKNAIRMMVRDMFDTRHAVGASDRVENPAVTALLSGYRIMRIG